MPHPQTLSPALIGRAEPLAMLEEHLARSARGQSAFVLLAGDAGVGKTRLLSEFLRRARAAPPAEILIGHCYEEEPAMPYRPIIEALGAWSRRRGPNALAGLAGPWAEDVARLIPELAPSRPVLAGDADDPGMKWRLFEGVAQVLRAVPSEPVRIVVFEDLHWSDQSSLELLRSLARSLSAERVLLLGTYRSDELHRRHPLAHWRAQVERERLVSLMMIRPLTRDEVAMMVDGIVGRMTPERLVSVIHDHSGGNPFFVEEILKTLVENGELEQALHSAQQGRGLGGVAIPLSVRDSVLRRTEGLDQAALEVLRYAAVVGRSFDFELLLDLTGQEEPALLRSIGTLIERQLVVEESREGDDQYQFRHALTREAIYEDLLGRERRRMHRAVLQAMERRPRETPNGDLDRLAYHSLQARELDKAAGYAVQAADQAVRRVAFREAVAHLEVALELKEASPPLERAELLYRLALASHPLGEVSVYRRYLEEARGMFQELAMLDRVAEIDLRLSRAAWEAGNSREAFALARAALAILEARPPSGELAMAYSNLSQLHMLDQDNDDAIRWADKAVALAEQFGHARARVNAWNNKGAALVDQGHVEAGLDYLKRSLDGSLELGLTFEAARAGNNIGSSLLSLGRFAEAKTWLARAEEIGTKGGLILSKSFVWANQASAAIQLGDWAEAETRLDRAIRAGEAGFSVSLQDAIPLRGYLHALRGDPRLALEMIESVRARVEKEGSLQLLNEFLPVLTESLYLAGRLEECRRALAQCGEVARRSGSSTASVLMLGVAATLYAWLGEPDAAEKIAVLLHEAESRVATLWARAWKAMAEGTRRASISDWQGAEQGLTEAIAAFTETGSVFWSARAKLERARARLHRGDIGRAMASDDWHQARAKLEAMGAAAVLAKAEDLERELGRPAAGRLEALTPREREVLSLLALGLSNRAIAERLVISVKTTEVHVSSILNKLNLKSRAAAAARAAEEGLAAGAER
jgi:DNA-binding CsgD family transcriptional regulator